MIDGVDHDDYDDNRALADWHGTLLRWVSICLYIYPLQVQEQSLVLYLSKMWYALLLLCMLQGKTKYHDDDAKVVTKAVITPLASWGESLVLTIHFCVPCVLTYQQ